MPEIRYTVNESSDGDQIRYNPTAEQRGGGVRGATGCAGSTSRCQHFPDNPTPEPDSPAVDFTGHYDFDGARGISPCTVQINQAGNYVYGWFQIDFYTPGITAPLDAAAGYFTGEVTRSGGAVEVYIDAPRGFEDPFQGSISNVTATDGAVNRMRLCLNRSSIRIRRDGRSMTVHEFDLHRVSNQPRLPEKALLGIRRSNPVLYQAEAHPLRHRQVETMGRWVREQVGYRLDQCFGHRGTALMGPFEGLFNFIIDSFSERNLGVFFRQEQTDLVKTIILHALETTEINLPRAGERKIMLEAIYQIADLGTASDQRGLFRRFRALFGQRDGQPLLPEHLGRYKYSVRSIYGQGTLPIPSSGVSLGGRGAAMTITREVWDEDAEDWQDDGESHTFGAAVGIVKVELSVGSRAGRRGGGGGSRGRGIVPSVEGGVNTFEFQSYRRWTWAMFPGYFEVFEVQAQIKLPFGIISAPSISDVAISFYGSGDVPALIATVENSSTTSLDNGREFQAQLGFGWYPGWLWFSEQERRSSAVDPTGLPSGQVSWGDRQFACFELDDVIIPEGGRADLGYVLAENLVLVLNGNSHMRLDGHASRRGSTQHNMVLSIRRAQFGLQVVSDILGDKLVIPLSRTAGSDGEGTIRVYAHGEEEAARRGDPDGSDIATSRRVEVCVNGSAVARLNDE